MNEAVKRDIDQMIRRLRELDEEQLQAGLTVYAWNTAEYLESNERADAELFWEIYETVQDRQHGRRAEKLDRDLSETNLPTGLAEAALVGEFDPDTLADPTIRHEWTIHPGSDFFETTLGAFDTAVCGEDGLEGKFERGEVGQADFPVLVVTMLLSDGFSQDTLWIPFTVCLTMLLIKRGVSNICAELPDDSTQEVDVDIQPESTMSVPVIEASTGRGRSNDIENTVEKLEQRTNELEEELQMTYDKLTDELSQSRKRNRELESEHTELKTEIERLEEEKTELEKKFVDMRAQIDTLREKNSALENEQDALREEIEELHRRLERERDSGLFDFF